MNNYNDGNWHGWNGGECPVHPLSVVDFITIEGNRNQRQAHSCGWGLVVNSIIAFRVTKEHKAPREFWVGGGYYFNSKREAKNAGVTDAIHVREVT